MIKSRLFAAALMAATLFASACTKSSTSGAWSVLDTNTNDAFFSVNFVSDDVGWLNGTSDRSYVPPEENNNENANKAPKPKPSPNAKKPEDPLKANQGFEVLQTTDGGATWK